LFNYLKKNQMEKKTKKILLVSGSLLLVGGAFWLWWRSRAKKDETKTDGNVIDTGNTGGGQSGGGSPVSQTSPTRPSNVLSFQRFANSKGYTPKLVEDGKWGSKTSAAWRVWGNDYEKGVTPVALKKGDRLMPRLPMANAVAYSAQTGKAIGRIKLAVFESPTSNSSWFFANTMIPTGALNIPTSTRVQLQTKDWIKA
jgi:hypothetical protein